MPDDYLGKFNKLLSEENSSLQAANERLEIENQRLRMELAEIGNGKIIPIERQSNIDKIANYKVKIALLERKLAKYEQVSATEKYGKQDRGTTAIISNGIGLDKKGNNSNKNVVKNDTINIEDETDCYTPQASVKINKQPLVRNTITVTKRMTADDVFNVIISHIKTNGPSTRKDISINTGLSDGQIANAIDKFSSKIDISADPDNKRRHLYSIS